MLLLKNSTQLLTYDVIAGQMGMQSLKWSCTLLLLNCLWFCGGIMFLSKNSPLFLWKHIHEHWYNMFIFWKSYPLAFISCMFDCSICHCNFFFQCLNHTRIQRWILYYRNWSSLSLILLGLLWVFGRLVVLIWVHFIPLML